MPFRSSSFSSTLRPLYGTPRWSRICTTWAENPHIGNCGLPFMNSTTSLLFTSLSMNWLMAMAFSFRAQVVRTVVLTLKLRFRQPSLHGKDVQRTPHLALQGVVNKLVLLNPRFAAKAFRQHGRGIMVAVAGEVPDRDLGIGNTGLDQRFDVIGIHRHGDVPECAPRLGAPESHEDYAKFVPMTLGIF